MFFISLLKPGAQPQVALNCPQFAAFNEPFSCEVDVPAGVTNLLIQRQDFPDEATTWPGELFCCLSIQRRAQLCLG